MKGFSERMNDARRMSEELHIKEALVWEEEPAVRATLILNENLQDTGFLKEMRETESNGLVIKAIGCKLNKLKRMSNQ